MVVAASDLGRRRARGRVPGTADDSCVDARPSIIAIRRARDRRRRRGLVLHLDDRSVLRPRRSLTRDKHRRDVVRVVRKRRHRLSGPVGSHGRRGQLRRSQSFPNGVRVLVCGERRAHGRPPRIPTGLWNLVRPRTLERERRAAENARRLPQDTRRVSTDLRAVPPRGLRRAAERPLDELEQRQARRFGEQAHRQAQGCLQVEAAARRILGPLDFDLEEVTIAGETVRQVFRRLTPRPCRGHERERWPRVEPRRILRRVARGSNTHRDPTIRAAIDRRRMNADFERSGREPRHWDPSRHRLRKRPTRRESAEVERRLPNDLMRRHAPPSAGRSNDRERRSTRSRATVGTRNVWRHSWPATPSGDG